jgi:hypothetical protein
MYLPFKRRRKGMNGTNALQQAIDIPKLRTPLKVNHIHQINMRNFGAAPLKNRNRLLWYWD